MKGVVRKGSLCNQILINDTMPLFMAKVSVMGCEKVDSIQRYVLQMPTGEVGSRIWKEKDGLQNLDLNYILLI